MSTRDAKQRSFLEFLETGRLLRRRLSRSLIHEQGLLEKLHL